MNYTYDIDKFKPVFESSFNWISGFLRNVRRYKNKLALIDPVHDKKWTYYELNQECNKFANALKNDGVEKNDVILYQLFNSPEFAFCYVAPQKLGAINSPANFNLAPGETAKMIDRNRPKVYVYDVEIASMALKALELCENKPKVILAVDFHNKRPELPKGHIFFDEYYKNEKDTEPDVNAEHNIYDEVTRLYTSGTTGLPKAIPVNNANEVLSAHDVLMHFPLSPKDVTMNMTPWFHRGGLHSGGLTPSFYVGATVVALRMFSAKTCLEYAEKYNVSFLIGVPAILNNLASRQERHPSDLSKLKGIVTMGSPLEKEACIRYQQLLTPNIFNGYGTTETFWNTFLRPYDLPEMAGSAGGSCTDDEVRIVNVYEDRKAEPDDIVATDGETLGEIIIYSCYKSVLSYPDSEELTEEKFYKGWMYTHDLGTWDENRYITIAGRKDDMIISRGENVYPAQVEEVINKNEKIEDCIVTAVKDKARGEAIVAYVKKSDDSLTVKELNVYCANSPDLSSYKCPRYYCFVDEIPYNATGKKLHYIAKQNAEKDLENGKLQTP